MIKKIKPILFKNDETYWNQKNVNNNSCNLNFDLNNRFWTPEVVPLIVF